MALLIEGEAGIGKTTLLREAVAAASDAGASVLMAWPAPAEAELAFSGLGDLLADELDEVVPELPEPQANALEIALLRRQAGGRPVDAHTVSAGVLGALRTLAERNPVVVAVDDVQWLDRGTAAALACAFRRLSSGRVRLVTSLRVEHASVRGEGPGGTLVGMHPLMAIHLADALIESRRTRPKETHAASNDASPGPRGQRRRAIARLLSGGARASRPPRRNALSDLPGH